jgi:hypothetical protein
MRDKYDLSVTRYIYERSGCESFIDVECETLYEFASADDPTFWCPRCQSEPHVRLFGCAAADLPSKLNLPHAFVLLPVPRLEPSDDLDSSNLLYRPYSQRSFLRQYIGWLKLQAIDEMCELEASATCFKRFNPELQRYTDEIDYELVDNCNSTPCRFLRTAALKPLSTDEVSCSVLKQLCNIRSPYDFCETGDEAQILWNYLLVTGAEHFPMLIPQASILSGRRRPDFLCFVPITRFQYQPVAVLVDRSGKNPAVIDSKNADYHQQGYRVRRILVEGRESGFSYFKAARELKNWIEGI